MSISDSIKSLPILRQGNPLTHNKHVLYFEDGEFTAELTDLVLRDHGYKGAVSLHISRLAAYLCRELL
jgi:hypothetical protein